MRMKNSKIKHAIFGLVAQCVNRMHHHSHVSLLVECVISNNFLHVKQNEIYFIITVLVINNVNII